MFESAELGLSRDARIDRVRDGQTDRGSVHRSHSSVAGRHWVDDPNPPTRTYQHAIFEQGQPAAMFYVDDVQREYERMKPLGAEFTMPPTKTTGSTIAVVNDTCGNLIQLTKLDW